MRVRQASLIVLSLFCLFGISLYAQDDACPTYVATALQNATAYCSGLNRNAACYGHNRVETSFWEAQPELVFAQAGDRVPVRSIQHIATAPLSPDEALWGIAILNLQADMPGTLPGQNVIFLLMGDVTMDSLEAPPPLEPVAATTTSDAPIYSGPSTQTTIIATMPTGQALQLVSMTEASDWFEVMLDNGGSGWIAAQAVDVDDTRALQMGMPEYYPMQMFAFTSGVGESGCSSAPDALVVQSPSGLQISFTINGLQVELGSTAVFTNVATDDGEVLVARILEGTLRSYVDEGRVQLDEDNNALALRINPDGVVDTTELVDLPVETVNETMRYACQNAVNSSIIGGVGQAQCEKETHFVTEALQPQHFNIDGCRFPNVIREGDVMLFRVGCCGAATLEEQIEGMSQAGAPWFVVDGERYQPPVSGIHYDGVNAWYTAEGEQLWTATEGAHTATGGWGDNASDTCPFTVQSR